jgi:hypothetical protein
MYERTSIFQSVLTDDELAMITGGQLGSLGSGFVGNGINIGQLGMGACDVCGSSLGLFTIGSAVGPFVSAFNNITINNGVA